MARRRSSRRTSTAWPPRACATPTSTPAGRSARRAAGYRTALFGKWGFGPEDPEHHSHPNAQGFDEFFGYATHMAAHDYYPSYLWHNRTQVPLPENEGTLTGTYAPDLFAQRTLEFIDAHHDEPFLVFLSTNMPHFPQHVPDLGPYADAPWGEPEKAHAAQITRMDGQVGALVAKLEEHDIARDTVIVFLSDNGPHEEGSPRLNPEFFESNGPLRGYKRNLYEGGIRVPMIVWAPGLQQRTAGTVSSATLTTWDILPTFAELAGMPMSCSPSMKRGSAAKTNRSIGSGTLASSAYKLGFVPTRAGDDPRSSS